MKRNNLLNAILILFSWITIRSKINIFKFVIASIFIGFLEVTTLILIQPVLKALNPDSISSLRNIYFLKNFNPETSFLIIGS